MTRSRRASSSLKRLGASSVRDRVKQINRVSVTHSGSTPFTAGAPPFTAGAPPPSTSSAADAPPKERSGRLGVWLTRKMSSSEGISSFSLPSKKGGKLSSSSRGAPSLPSDQAETSAIYDNPPTSPATPRKSRRRSLSTNDSIVPNKGTSSASIGRGRTISETGAPRSRTARALTTDAPLVTTRL
eukprot:CAMPEP_0119327108 /NCGR_PEP_ID=MMETSP1333-20130426/69931_1 /TAXON_ID=418940 /ORGANISM="Scyphosphaera apsteinii, Strain RCC1455" /LENGTH=184 /DNA_ID=CAMNT_0007335599 /DNA_START=45 /DNA_END=599 /DNA_ORIENTATION=-